MKIYVSIAEPDDASKTLVEALIDTGHTVIAPAPGERSYERRLFLAESSDVAVILPPSYVTGDADEIRDSLFEGGVALGRKRAVYFPKRPTGENDMSRMAQTFASTDELLACVAKDADRCEEEAEASGVAAGNGAGNDAAEKPLDSGQALGILRAIAANHEGLTKYLDMLGKSVVDDLSLLGEATALDWKKKRKLWDKNVDDVEREYVRLAEKLRPYWPTSEPTSEPG